MDGGRTFIGAESASGAPLRRGMVALRADGGREDVQVARRRRGLPGVPFLVAVLSMARDNERDEQDASGDGRLARVESKRPSGLSVPSTTLAPCDSVPSTNLGSVHGATAVFVIARRFVSYERLWPRESMVRDELHETKNGKQWH